MIARFQWNKSGLIAGMVLLLFLLGCSTSGEPSPGVPVEQTTVTATIVPTQTPTPTETPLPPVGVLLAAPGADPRLMRSIQETVSDWMEQNGYRFQVLPSLSSSDFQLEDYRWVVALPPVENLVELAQSSPGTHFLAVGFPGMEPLNNLSVIGGQGFPHDQQGFLAGYIAAILTPDWRIGVISAADTTEGTSARDGFINGALFYCPNPMGFCSPSYAPFYEYPLFAELNSDSRDIDWQSAADYLIFRNVETIFVAQGAGGDPLLKYLSQEGIKIIGSGSPPESAEENWIASLVFNPLSAFDSAWSDFTNDVLGISYDIPMSIEHVNGTNFSPGRLRLAEEMLDELADGFVGTGVSTEDDSSP